jgi:hypothetical protein
LILTLLQILPLNNTSFSQTTPEKAAELWNLRQSEIQQLYQEGNLEGALNSAQESVSLAEVAFGSGALKNHFQYVVTGTNPWRIRST